MRKSVTNCDMKTCFSISQIRAIIETLKQVQGDNLISHSKFKSFLSSYLSTFR